MCGKWATTTFFFDARYQKNVRDWFAAQGYKVESYKQSNHDCYLKKPVYNFEMHTELFSDAFMPENKIFMDYYKNVKQRLLPDEGKNFGYHFSDEDFYVYITAHAFKHYNEGGTGLRTLLDFYVYLSVKSDGLDLDYIHAELEKTGLANFEDCTRRLINKLFTDPEYLEDVKFSPDEKKMLNRYLSSGTYGTTEKLVKSKILKLSEDGNITNETKLKYLKSRLFPERKLMNNWCKSYAPFFANRSRLLPLAYAYRLLTKSVASFGKWTRELKTLKKLN